MLRLPLSWAIIVLGVLAGLEGPSATNAASNRSTRSATLHVAHNGETITFIGESYGVSTTVLARANGLNDNAIVLVGDRLIIPASNIFPAFSRDEQVIVGISDTLESLSVMYGVDVTDLANANWIVNPQNLYAGLAIWIPPTTTDGDPQALSSVSLIKADSIRHAGLMSNQSIWSVGLLNHARDLTGPYPNSEFVVPARIEDGSAPISLGFSVVMLPLPVEQGRCSFILVKTSGKVDLTGLFLSHKIQFVLVDENTYWAAVGVDRWTKPGAYPIAITITDDAGIHNVEQVVSVVSGGYQTETLRLSEDLTSSLNDSALIQQEEAYLAKTMAAYSNDILWNGLFQIPAVGVFTSAFGTVRTYGDGGLIDYHHGADIAGPVGTPIFAPANGVVVDTGLLDLRGYITIIDHGGGVVTGYWHQSSILVRPGDYVEAGQQIGTMGNTGLLATASHLHWEMWVGGVPVDPLQWVWHPSLP